MIRTLVVLVSLLLLANSLFAQRSITLPQGTQLNMRLVADNVGYPSCMTQEDGGALWLTDRSTGKILRIVPSTGEITMVLQIDLTVSPTDPAVRGGVFGIALHPQFSNGSPIVFVSSTRVGDTLVIERYRFDGQRLVEPMLIFSTPGVPVSQGLTLETLADNTLLVSVGSFDNLDPNRMENVNGKLIRMSFEGNTLPSNPLFSETFPKSAQ